MVEVLPEFHSFLLHHSQPPVGQSRSSADRGQRVMKRNDECFVNEEKVTFPPTLIPSVTAYIAFGGFGAACAENKPFGLSTNSRFRSFPGAAPTWNS